MLKKIPLPITGVALGFAALGNLIAAFSPEARLACGGVAAMLLMLYVLKMIAYPDTFAGDMKNPIMASVFCTATMCLMLLAGYLKPFAPAVAPSVWYAAVALHALLIVFFTVRFMLPPQLPKVFASYYIVYVGIAVAGVTAPAFGALGIGQSCFWFGLVALVLLLVLVTRRYATLRDVPPPAQPLFCIYAAPAALSLAAYLQSFPSRSAEMVYALLTLALTLFVIVLVRLPGYLKMPFFPSYAAFTFPFVISAIAVKGAGAALAAMGSPLAFLPPLANVMTVLAAVLCVYTLVRFAGAIAARNNK